MFTQCPDCQTTFRVTAAVLQQAEGRVRCGGCSNAFNALEHLFEETASQRGESAENPTGSTTNQNRQLLETLEKLAGPDVTIEDTGVEWRVLGDAGGDAPKTAAMLGRQDDIPRPVSKAQESLDLSGKGSPETDPNELRFDDDTILPDDFGMEDDLDELPFLEKAEPPKRRAGDREEIRDTSEFDEAQADLALGEPDDWVDLLEEVSAEDDEEEVSAEEEASAEEDEGQEGDWQLALEAADADEAAQTADTADESHEEEQASEEPAEDDMPSDIDTQFLLQAEEMGIDTGTHEIIGADDVAAAADETESDEHDPDATDAVELGAEYEDQANDETLTLEEEEEDESAAEARTGEELEQQTDLAAEPIAAEGEDDSADGKPDESLEPQSADQTAHADAADDTPAADTEDDIESTIIGGKKISELFDEDSPLVETIIMEGEMISDAMDLERKRANRALGRFRNLGSLEDTYSLTREKIRGGRRAGDPAGHMVIAAVVILGLMLIGQVVHQSRQTLATHGAFNHTIGPIYRVLGKPVTPDWDIRGWQFETTNGSVDEEEDLLTIYSRIANQSSQALPYPLVHISLTDRWEDVIGSRVLEPSQYLAGDLDPRKPVPPGENFTAVITIESPAAEATGFRLTPCYRIAEGRVRCATQDFKN